MFDLARVEMPFFFCFDNISQSWSTFRIFACVVYVCVCVLLLSSTIWWKVWHYFITDSTKSRWQRTNKKCGPTTDTRRTPVFLYVTLTLWAFFNITFRKKKHSKESKGSLSTWVYEELLGPNHSTITEQVTCDEKCAKREDMYSTSWECLLVSHSSWYWSLFF